MVMSGSQIKFAPGWHGIEPRWTSSAKSGIGTALSDRSHVWFAIGHGILNEIYYPRLDLACTRDMGLMVSDGIGYFSEEKRSTIHTVDYLSPNIPAFRLVNTAEDKRYKIEKEIVADPLRDVVAQRIRFTPLQGSAEDYHLYVLLAPHLSNRGNGNTAWIGDYKGARMLFAENNGIYLAVACSAPWLKASAGFVGVSDGWQDVSRHKTMTWEYDRAENGNVALTGEMDLISTEGKLEIAVGFGISACEAGQLALSSLQDGFSASADKYIEGWLSWQNKLFPSDKARAAQYDMRQISAAVLKTHESKRFPGGMIASLSVPWGSSKGDDDLGGYHLVWPRDLVETAGGLLAAGAEDDAVRVLNYLQATQESDGHWQQNMWLDGSRYWSGIQMDETAFPILLVDMAYRNKAIAKEDLNRYWDMVRRAAGYIIHYGPVSEQDRWEEDPGYSPFTLAVEIAALLAAADLADIGGEKETAEVLRHTADSWNDSIERWIYTTDSALSRKLGIEGYYVRIAPPELAEGASPKEGFVPIKNRPPGQTDFPPSEIVSPDSLALVRLGLRAADDPKIVNTIRVIDSILKVETPVGASWHRYANDGYGEHVDGSPFDGTGTGRAWPLLTGERAHYEIAAGRIAEAEKLMKAMESFSNDGGLIPEQIWDTNDIPEKELCFGKPTGSAMPLVWAHAEYIKLARSMEDGRVFDMPPQTVKRYLEEKKAAEYACWSFSNKLRSVKNGIKLRLITSWPVRVHWTPDNWKTTKISLSKGTSLGVHYADIDTAGYATGSEIKFTFYWTESGSWEGQDFSVSIGKSA